MSGHMVMYQCATFMTDCPTVLPRFVTRTWSVGAFGSERQ